MILPHIFPEDSKVVQIGIFAYKDRIYSPKELLLKINVADFTRSHEKPDTCYNCASKFIVPLEILDIYPDPILWSCLKCGFKSLKFDFEHISKMIEDARDVYAIPEHFSNLKSIEA